MAHETILYGYIEGSTYTTDEYRRLQLENRKVVESLPEYDEYPYLSRCMFSIPGEDVSQGTFRAQVIHFGASQKSLEFSDIPPWICKFEKLLRKLYWFAAVVHLETEVDGNYVYRWSVSSKVIDTYHRRDPIPTSEWEREVVHNGETSQEL